MAKRPESEKPKARTKTAPVRGRSAAGARSKAKTGGSRATKGKAKSKASKSSKPPVSVDLVQARADFVRYYIEQDFRDATGAYRKAYKNANISTAAVEACRLLKDPKVQEALSAELEAVLKARRRPLEKRILDTWLVRAFYDPTEILDLKGELKITEAQLRKKGLHVCIDSIAKKLNNRGQAYLEYKLADRDKALDMLQKYIAMIREPEQNINLHTDDPLTLVLNGVKAPEPKT